MPLSPFVSMYHPEHGGVTHETATEESFPHWEERGWVRVSDDYASWSVAELRTRAEELGVDVSGLSKKRDLADALAAVTDAEEA